MKEPPFIDVHTHRQRLSDNQTITVVSLSLPDLIPQTSNLKLHTVGLHPWYIGPVSFNPDELRSLARHPDCIGIGETGLDKLRGPAVTIQKEVFREHVTIACEVGKPVIIHCVRAWEEIIRLKKELNPTVPWIIHGYRGNPLRAGQLIAAGFYLSFGAALLSGDPGLQDSWRQCPAGRLFLETDESPEPVSSLYEQGARLRDIPVSELKTYIVSNFERVFGFHANT